MQTLEPAELELILHLFKQAGEDELLEQTASELDSTELKLSKVKYNIQVKHITAYLALMKDQSATIENLLHWVQSTDDLKALEAELLN